MYRVHLLLRQTYLRYYVVITLADQIDAVVACAFHQHLLSNNLIRDFEQE